MFSWEVGNSFFPAVRVQDLVGKPGDGNQPCNKGGKSWHKELGTQQKMEIWRYNPFVTYQNMGVQWEIQPTPFIWSENGYPSYGHLNGKT